jgi:hypothetical protein
MQLIQEGFLDYAKDSGLSDKEAAHIFKRALEYPGTEEVFKKLDITPTENKQPAPGEISALSKLIEQERVHSELQKIKKQLGI